MKKVKIKIPAKINLTLDVVGKNDGYHDIKSLVTSVDVFDQITVTERKDHRINLMMSGIPVDVEEENNNAFKTAKLFMEKYSTLGVDIKIKKGIPVGAGMGGSSADVAGVLIAMNRIYDVNADLKELADSLGSDVAYMLEGGYAVISGRGEKIAKKDIRKTLYFIILTDKKSVSAKDSYKKFDSIGKNHRQCTNGAVKALSDDDFYRFKLMIKNDLLDASAHFSEGIKHNLYVLEMAGAPAKIMTGSGSAVLGVFESERERNETYRKLEKLYKKAIIKAKTYLSK